MNTEADDDLPNELIDSPYVIEWGEDAPSLDNDEPDFTDQLIAAELEEWAR